MMDRRGFIANAFIVLAAPLAAEAQEVGKIHQIGHVSLMSPAGMAPYVQEFEKALGQLGYVKGRNYVLINRSANDKPGPTRRQCHWRDFRGRSRDLWQVGRITQGDQSQAIAGCFVVESSVPRRHDVPEGDERRRPKAWGEISVD